MPTGLGDVISKITATSVMLVGVYVMFAANALESHRNQQELERYIIDDRIERDEFLLFGLQQRVLEFTHENIPIDPQYEKRMKAIAQTISDLKKQRAGLE